MIMLTHYKLLIGALLFPVTIAQVVEARLDQTPLHSHVSESFTSAKFSDMLSEGSFSTLRHPQFPKHSVRVKKSNFCDPSVAAYTGYIDVEARHLFFYFFESRRDPARDDVVYWTNGGPGASSAFGLFMGLGPCRVRNGTTVIHPESWNKYTNIFFIDQPVGVGFSYGDHGETVFSTEEAAKDIAAFISIFFQHFTQFKGRPLHMAGESYGGRYIPAFAAAVYDNNAELVKEGLAPINLASIMIGNGLVDPVSFQTSQADIQCTAASGLPPVMPVGTCVRMRIAVKRCEKWLREACVDVYDAIGCTAASDYCEKELTTPFIQTGRNIYDVSKMCEGDPDEDACYPAAREIRKLLDQPLIRKQIGVDPSLPANFSFVGVEANENLWGNGDRYAQSYLYVRELLERGVKVLIYAGAYDFISNWVGQERWTTEFQWSGHDAFSSQSLREWKMGDRAAGLARDADGLTFVTIYGAGHMAPYDKPQESLEMLRKWVEDESF